MKNLDNKSIIVGLLLGVCFCLILVQFMGPGIKEANASAKTGDTRSVGQYQAFGLVGPNGSGYYMLNTQTGELWAAFALHGAGTPGVWAPFLKP